jgi:hypothetical protein
VLIFPEEWNTKFMPQTFRKTEIQIQVLNFPEWFPMLYAPSTGKMTTAFYVAFELPIHSDFPLLFPIASVQSIHPFIQPHLFCPPLSCWFIMPLHFIQHPFSSEMAVFFIFCQSVAQTSTLNKLRLNWDEFLWRLTWFYFQIHLILIHSVSFYNNC